jgi:hypothetical protein
MGKWKVRVEDNVLLSEENYRNVESLNILHISVHKPAVYNFVEWLFMWNVKNLLELNIQMCTFLN